MDQYQRLKVLGRGSYGSAVLVRESRGSKQLRVIKEIDTSRLPAGAQKEVHTEVGVLKSLSHPNIVAYCDAFFDGTKLCIVMEFADGGDLSASVKEHASEGRRFSENQAMSIFAQCCLALQHVHSKHVLHRDLKAQNIFMTAAKVVKLGDFGVARVLDHTAAEAVTMIGTPIYLAPEVCNSKPYGTKADIWSLGVVLYELCALKPPFQGSNIASLCMKIMRTEPDPLPVELYSEEARDIVTWMLRKSANGRPSVDQLLAQPLVRRIATHLPGGAAVPSEDCQAAAAHENGRAEKPHRPQQRAPSGTPSDVASEFHRNRELAAMLKARAEGASRPPGLPRSNSSEGPAAAVRSPTPEGPRGGKAAEEQRHLQALQDAAAQARRDRRQVQQRMRDLEECEGQRAPSKDPCPGAAEEPGVGRGHGRRPSSLDAAAAKRAAEEEHRQALQEAAAQARRDRREVQQRVKELERAPGGREALESPGRAAERCSSQSRAAAKQSDEVQHLQALQEAAAEARRERKALQQKMRELDQDASRDGAQGVAPLPSSEAAPETRKGTPSGDARVQQEAEHLRALQEAAAEARRERRMLQQRQREADSESECGVWDAGEVRGEVVGPRASSSRAAVEALSARSSLDHHPRSGDMEADKTHRRVPGRSSLSFAGGLLMGSRPGSRASSVDHGNLQQVTDSAPANAAQRSQPLDVLDNLLDASARLGSPGSAGDVGHGAEVHGCGNADRPPLDACYNLTRILPRFSDVDLCADEPVPQKPALQSRVSTPEVGNAALAMPDARHRIASSTPVESEGGHLCPSEVNSSDNHTLGGSSLFSYTATGTLSALSCVAAP